MSYLPNYDILRRLAPVSRNFYQISQDQHLVRRIEFEFKEISDVGKWSEDRQEKYYNDLLEVVKESRQLKFLSFKMKSTDKRMFPSLDKILEDLSSIKDQCLELEEFCFTSKTHIWIYNIIESVFGYLDKCPKLKIIKLGKIKLDDRILKELKKSELKTLEEFHLTFTGSIETDSLKFLLEIISEKPNIQCIFLTLQRRNFQVERVCQEFGLKKKVKIRTSYPGCRIPGYPGFYG